MTKKKKRKPVSAATKKKISDALKGKKHRHKGHKTSAATREKLRKALKGKKHPHKGHKMSAATRAKISAALKARYKNRPHKQRKKALPRHARYKAVGVRRSRNALITVSHSRVRRQLTSVRRHRHRPVIHHPRAHRVWRRRAARRRRRR